MRRKNGRHVAIMTALCVLGPLLTGCPRPPEGCRDFFFFYLCDSWPFVR